MNSSFLSYFWQHQPHLFRFWSQLTQEQQNKLAHQLEHIHLDTLKKQQGLICKPLIHPAAEFEPFEDFAFSGNRDHQLTGQQLIEQGRLGCLLLAGGQGTRLQYKGPKGTYPISIVQRKSLFQLFAEKVRAASQKAGHPLKLAIMTAPENDQETRLFFQAHGFFGLNPNQISFFTQETLPLLDEKGHLFLQTMDQVAEGSDGNGHSLLSFAQSGILAQWLKQGVAYMHVILVDNPLADPFDTELLGFHFAQEAEITLKCTEKIKPEERVGMLVRQQGRCSVVEYSEMSNHEKEARRPDGRLKHCCANLSLFCFSLSFIQRMAARQQFLPLHKAWKAVSYLDEKGIYHFPSQPNAWKFETFIFDWLMHAQKVAALIYPREHCFAPLKNAQGNDSPETVRQALQQADRRMIEAITGISAPNTPFELAADFHYPTPDLLKKWKGKTISSDYVEA